MSRFLPYPMLSVALALLWLALNNTLTAAHCLLAVALGFVLPVLARRMLGERPPGAGRPTARRLRLGFALALRLLSDIVVANLSVAKRILFSRESALAPTMVELELRLKTPSAIAALAGIVTLTPGTLSADIDEAEAGGTYLLRVHALDAPDPDALAAEIRSRYEEPLLEMLR